jgi:peptidoglycan/LPS O-acetylase OafA/YrhL
LGCGAALALLTQQNREPEAVASKVLAWSRNIGVPLFLLLVAASFLRHFSVSTTIFLELSASVAFLWLIAGAARGFNGLWGRVLEFPPLLYLGRISYGLYLYHAFVPDSFKAVMRMVGIPLTAWDVPAPLYHLVRLFSGPFATKVTALIMIVIYFSITTAAASLSWYLWEHPLNGLRKYVRYRGLKSASN